MNQKYDKTLREKSDRDIVKAIITKPYDETAAVYLICERYAPLCKRLCSDIFGDMSWYDDVVHDFLIYLKGKEENWAYLRNFQWRCKFGHWLALAARNFFLEDKKHLIGNNAKILSIDETDENGKPLSKLPDNWQEEQDRMHKKLVIIEALSLMSKTDYRFVTIEALKGFKNQEIAENLQRHWKETGVVKYNKKGEVLIPDEKYINTLRQRARIELKNIIIANDLL